MKNEPWRVPNGPRAPPDGHEGRTCGPFGSPGPPREKKGDFLDFLALLLGSIFGPCSVKNEKKHDMNGCGHQDRISNGPWTLFLDF